MITLFKTFLMNENKKTVKSNDLKKYAEYLINEYKKINPIWKDSGFYSRLKQFCEEGKIKGLLYKNDKIETKIEILNIYRNDFANFCKNINNNVDIETFEDFFLKLYFPDEYSLKKDSKKYNL